jgi:hypothetical protein
LDGPDWNFVHGFHPPLCGQSGTIKRLLRENTKGTVKAGLMSEADYDGPAFTEKEKKIGTYAGPSIASLGQLFCSFLKDVNRLIIKA